jgi:hypothetical protein
MKPQPTVHFVRNADGGLQSFTAIPFMTLEEAREYGAAKIADPNFIQQQIAQASAAVNGGDNAAG